VYNSILYNCPTPDLKIKTKIGDQYLWPVLDLQTALGKGLRNSSPRAATEGKGTFGGVRVR